MVTASKPNPPPQDGAADSEQSPKDCCACRAGHQPLPQLTQNPWGRGASARSAEGHGRVSASLPLHVVHYAATALNEPEVTEARRGKHQHQP